MADPRKRVHVPMPARQQEVRDIVHRHLLLATENGAREIGTTGASFVLIGIGVWAAEINELDPRAAAKLLRAIADIYDPHRNGAQKRRAEKDRAQAVRSLLAAVDLEMSEAQGHG